MVNCDINNNKKEGKLTEENKKKIQQLIRQIQEEQGINDPLKILEDCAVFKFEETGDLRYALFSIKRAYKRLF